MTDIDNNIDNVVQYVKENVRIENNKDYRHFKPNGIVDEPFIKIAVSQMIRQGNVTNLNLTDDELNIIYDVMDNFDIYPASTPSLYGGKTKTNKNKKNKKTKKNKRKQTNKKNKQIKKKQTNKRKKQIKKKH